MRGRRKDTTQKDMNRNIQGKSKREREDARKRKDKENNKQAPEGIQYNVQETSNRIKSA